MSANTLSEAMGLRYLVWHPISERPPPQNHPLRHYLVWLRASAGRVQYGVPRVIRWSKQSQGWLPADMPGTGSYIVTHWAEIPRPVEAGADTLEQPPE